MEKFYPVQIKRFFGSIVTIGYCGFRFWVEPSNPYFDYAFTFIFMFLLGIPHGAGDHLLIQKQKKEKVNILSSFVILEHSLILCLV